MVSIGTSLTDLENVKCNLEKIIYDLNGQKHSMEARNEELRTKSGEVKHLNKQLENIRTSELNLQVKVEELQSAQANFESKERRMAEEREILIGQICELKDKNEELLSSSRKKGNDILQLKLKLKNKDDELNGLKTEMAHLQKQNGYLLETLKEVGSERDTEIRNSQKLQTELDQLRQKKTSQLEDIGQQFLELEEKFRNQFLKSNNKISQLRGGAEQFLELMKDLEKQLDEDDVQRRALKSQFEGLLSRQEEESNEESGDGIKDQD